MIDLQLAKYLQSVTIAPNSILTNSSNAGVETWQNLQTLILDGASAQGVTLRDLRIDKCTELSSLSLNGVIGLGILENNAANALLTSVPATWKFLTRLKTVSFANCGLTKEQVSKLIIDWCATCKLGMGSSNATGNSLVINGLNAKPDLTIPEVVAAKAWLLANGWTVTHL
jgi:hypothetical protein